MPFAGRPTSADTRERLDVVTVFLVDSQPLTREALSRVLETSSEAFLVVRLREPLELRDLPSPEGPALVLLNAGDRPSTDHEVLERVRTTLSLRPDLPVVLLAEFSTAQNVLAAVACGVRGCIPTTLELQPVVEVLRFIAAGGTFVPAEPLLAALARDTPATRRELGATLAAASERHAKGFTPRQRAVLQLLRLGRSNKEIARELDMGETTVRVHVRHVLRKLGATNRTQAALLWEQLEQEAVPDDA